MKGRTFTEERSFVMRVVCSYCARTLREVPGGAGVSHGMCEECDRHFARLWEGMKVGEYLDGLPRPVLVVDGDGRVLGANRRLGSWLRRDAVELRGLLAGEAFACARSRLPGGCGKTVHCRECAVRRAVTQVATTGRPVAFAPAYLQTAAGRVDLVVSARPLGGAVEVTLERASEPDGVAAAAG